MVLQPFDPSCIWPESSALAQSSGQDWRLKKEMSKTERARGVLLVADVSKFLDQPADGLKHRNANQCLFGFQTGNLHMTWSAKDMLQDTSL